MSVQVTLADLNSLADQDAVIALLDMYCRDPFGASKPLPDETKERLIAGLRECRGICFLASEGNPAVPSEFIGLALCLPSFSSFRARPVLNIHDIAVAPSHRGKRVGQALLKAVEDEARRRGCCKVTLEVRSDNAVAMATYRRAGFTSTEPETYFWGRELG
jgi:ribosomal protein S18 acetylase RimI-like enzyme